MIIAYRRCASTAAVLPFTRPPGRERCQPSGAGTAGGSGSCAAAAGLGQPAEPGDGPLAGPLAGRGGGPTGGYEAVVVRAPMNFAQFAALLLLCRYRSLATCGKLETCCFIV